ncbi:hypothetical protein ACHQM5_017662 [Ranunculus cassubicifolius]
MAQLPPKIPNMTPNWSNFSHHKVPSMSNLSPIPTNHHHHNQNPSWIDEFLDFSSAKRNAHRRSASDSITFLETPIIEECHSSSTVLRSSDKHEFDRLDDEQLMSMFSDDVSGNNVGVQNQNVCVSNPSTPSDQNSNNDSKPGMLDPLTKNEAGEVQSSCKQESDSQLPPTPSTSNGSESIDPKRVKRILANRQSAQRSRVRKLQYISELERSVTSLQTEVSTLSPRVAYLDHQRLVLNVDNSALKQRIAALAQDKIFKDAHQEALKKELERLRQVYHQQSLKKMDNTNNSNSNSNSS